jgi:alkylation response protein AidB-like acyl-CoA dehydrogenase
MEQQSIAGLDGETLDFTLESISEFARRELPDSLLIELDERDEFPEELVRRMCDEELGVQLLFIPEEFGGPGGGAVDVYRVYLHGPAYQVLERAWCSNGDIVGRLPPDLPPAHEPPGQPTEIAPRLIELCFPTAGVGELGKLGRMGLPTHVGRWCASRAT